VPRPVMAYALAMAAARDAANRQMRAAGRTAWSEDDYELACATFERLWPIGSECAESHIASEAPQESPCNDAIA
jgi:hypothetical protein